jgi:hypothetical protein
VIRSHVSHPEELSTLNRYRITAAAAVIGALAIAGPVAGANAATPPDHSPVHGASQAGVAAMLGGFQAGAVAMQGGFQAGATAAQAGLQAGANALRGSLGTTWPFLPAFPGS